MIRTAGQSLSVLFLAAGLIPAAAQSKAPADAGTPVFRLQVRRVPVDVVVLDKDGNPVRGLKKDDFVVKEDGKTQHVLTFDVFDASKPGPPLPKAPSLPPNTFTNAPAVEERGPLYILYYDMVNTPKEDQMLFRRELLQFIDTAPKGVRIALFVNAAGLHLLQGFTTDHELLRQAVQSNGPGPHVPQVFLYGNVYGTNDVIGCLSNMTFLSEYLNGIPGRKNLIWLASNFPIPVSPTMTGRSTVVAGQTPGSFSVGSQGGPVVLDLTELERENIRRTYTAMMKSQIALYPVDLSGVVGTHHLGQSADAMIDHENFDMIASATGGRAMYGNNHPAKLIEKAVEHGENYYTLTYDPTNTRYEGDERNIQVTLAKKNKDYQITYRHVYYALGDNAEQKQQKHDPLQARFLAAKAQDTLYANIEHGAPLLHDLLFSAQVAPEGGAQMATPEQMQALQDAPDYFKTRRKNKPQTAPKPIKLQKYVIDYGVIDPQLKAMAAHGQKAVLEFAAAAYNDDGRLLNSILNQGVPTGTNKTSKALFHAIQELEAPPGTAYIRLAVRDTATNRTGTVEVKLPPHPDAVAPQAQAMGAAQ
jgi:VWFA-related protein